MNLRNKGFNLNKRDFWKKNNNGLLKVEVEFFIKIENSNFVFSEYEDKLNRAANIVKEDIKYDKFHESSSFELFVREKLKQIEKKNQIILVVTDYSEREGSFIISFSFLVFTIFMNYGQFRDSLDYLRKDFDFLLKDVFPYDTHILIDYNIRSNHLINEDDSKQTFQILNRRLNILMLVGILALGFLFYAVYKIETQPSQQLMDNSTTQAIVRAEIDKVNSEQTNKELIRLLKQQLEKTKSEETK